MARDGALKPAENLVARVSENIAALPDVAAIKLVQHEGQQRQ